MSLFSLFYRDFSIFVTLLLIINIVLAIVTVLFERRNPMTTLVWLMVIFFFPIIGFVFYLFLGQDLKKRKLFTLKHQEEDKLIRTKHYQKTLLSGNQYKFKDERIKQYTDMITLHLTSGDAPLSDNNRVQIFNSGQEKFTQLMESIKQAKKFIHIEYYIIRNDSLGREIIILLSRKAKEGIEVRLLYDGMGGIRLPKNFFDPLLQAGGKVAVFYPPFIPYINLRVNYRNHRKKTGRAARFSPKHHRHHSTSYFSNEC
jgi:cardiolipin synthase